MGGCPRLGAAAPPSTAAATWLCSPPSCCCLLPLPPTAPEVAVHAAGGAGGQGLGKEAGHQAVPGRHRRHSLLGKQQRVGGLGGGRGRQRQLKLAGACGEEGRARACGDPGRVCENPLRRCLGGESAGCWRRAGTPGVGPPPRAREHTRLCVQLFHAHAQRRQRGAHLAQHCAAGWNSKGADRGRFGAQAEQQAAARQFGCSGEAGSGRHTNGCSHPGPPRRRRRRSSRPRRPAGRAGRRRPRPAGGAAWVGTLGGAGVRGSAWQLHAAPSAGACCGSLERPPQPRPLPQACAAEQRSSSRRGPAPSCQHQALAPGMLSSRACPPTCLGARSR